MMIKFLPQMKNSFITAINTIVRYNSMDINIHIMQSKSIIINCFNFKSNIDYQVKYILIREVIRQYRNDVDLMKLLHNKQYDNVISGFENIADKVFREIASKIEEYKIIFFVNGNYNLFMNRNKFNVFGREIHIVTWDSVKDMNLDEGWQKIRLRNRNKDLNLLFTTNNVDGYEQYKVNKNFTPVIISITSFHSYQAFREAEEIFLLWRVSINLQHALNLFSRLDTGGQVALPLSKCILSPAIFLFNQEKILQFVATNDIFRNYGFMNGKSIDFDRFDYNLSIINDNSKKINTFIREVLSLYQEAIDETNPSGLFMRLWQVLERICLDDPSGKNTLKRLFTLVSASPDDPIRPFMEVINTIRNEFVHKGRFDSNADLIFSLKGAIDRAIICLMNLSNVIKDEEELKLYYGFQDQGDAVLERHLRVLESIKESRKPQ